MPEQPQIELMLNPSPDLIEEVDVPQSLFFMAVGWLSREGKLQFEPADGDYLVRLA